MLRVGKAAPVVAKYECCLLKNTPFLIEDGKCNVIENFKKFTFLELSVISHVISIFS